MKKPVNKEEITNQTVVPAEDAPGVDVPKRENSLLQMVQYMNAMDEAIAIAAEQNEGEIPLDLEESLLIVKEKHMPDKVDGYAFILDALKYRREFWKAKVDKLRRVISAIDHHEDKLKHVLLEGMKRLDTTDLAGHEYVFRVQMAKPKVIIDDEAKIPAAHKVIVQTTQIKKEGILEDLKQGKAVPGAHLEESPYVRCYTNTKGVKDVKRIKGTSDKGTAAPTAAKNDGGAGKLN